MAKDEKLDWIYKSANSLVDREEYLLGRKVDKTLEQINQEEKEKKFVLPTPKNHVEHECIPPSIRDFNKIVLAEQVDLSAKLQEDPLVAIKKREEEARKQFLQNPVQLKKLQEALKKQEEQKKKHKKSKKKHSDDDLDEKIKEKFKMLKNSPLGIGFPKKATKKESEDTLNTILMHKFNALKEKLSEEDLQDILNGKVSDESDEDEPKKKKEKKRKGESSESEHDERKRKSKKNRDSDLSSEKGKKNKVRSSSSRDSDKNMEKVLYRKKRDYSSEKDSKKKSRSPNRRRESEKSYSRRYEAHSGKYDKFKDRGRSREDRDYHRNRSPSDEKIRKNEKKERMQQRDAQDATKKQKYIRRNSSSESDNDKHDKSDSDLDEKIMAKLRILRGEVEIKTKETLPDNSSYSKKESDDSSSSDDEKSSSEIPSKGKKLKTLLPEKPSHLKLQSKSRDCTSSEENTYRKKYSDSEEEQQPKSFGLVTSAGKKVTLGKTEHKVDVKTIKKAESTTRPERRQVNRLTEKEKEKLREEMMRNAEVRDKEREKNVKRYREKEKREEEMVATKFDADRVHTELLKSAKLSSIEQRIKSNLNNIQRSSRHMDSNFSKR